MQKSGHFLENEAGTTAGHIEVLGTGIVPVHLDAAQTSKKGNAYQKVIAKGHTDHPYEIGVAYPKYNGTQKFYSLELDSPMFSEPIEGLLWPDGKGGYDFSWKRKTSMHEMRPRSEANGAQLSLSL